MVQRYRRYASKAMIAVAMTAVAGEMIARKQPFGVGDGPDFVSGAVVGIGIGVTLVLLIKARQASS